MNYEIKIKKDYNNNIYIQILPLKLGIIGIIFYKNNNYVSHHRYCQIKIIKFLIDNKFIIILKQEIINNVYNKYTLQLTSTALLKVL